MWEEYNPELEIHALDIDENINKWIQQPNPYHIYIGDQTDASTIDDVAKNGGPFNFIIDDGSHVGHHITASFKMLWQHLKPGGYYFIEDLHAGHANRQETIKTITEFLAGQFYFMTLLLDAKLLIIEKR